MRSDDTFITNMSAEMSATKFAVFVILFRSVLCEKFKQYEIEIETNIGGHPPQVFTSEDIAKYDGTNPDDPIYIAVRGVVFDVTSGKGFYSKDSEYNVLVGKDASRAHALWSLDPADLTHDLSGLTDEQLQGLDMVLTDTYMKKYPIVGYMDYLIHQDPDTIKKRFTNEEL